MPALRAVHKTDPREDLMKQVGDISDHELFHNAVMVAIYLRPKTVMLGGKEFELTDSTRKEDEYQGKVGLVIGKGPSAFVPGDDTDFAGMSVNVGDWIVFRASDGWPITLVRGDGPKDHVLCRVMTEKDIRMRIPSPDYVW
jgi:hypothetical protein